MYIGDTLRGEATVLSVHARRPMADLRFTVTNQRGDEVLRGDATVYQAIPARRSVHDGVGLERDGEEGTLSVVKINAIEVPEGGGAELEQRFAARAKAVDGMPGFEGFELLRPVSGETRDFVYTKWATEEDFQSWLNSQAFQQGHSGSSAGGPQRPVGTGSALLSFEVVDLGGSPG